MSRIRVATHPSTAPPSQPAQPSTRPLTHHEILGLIGPFTRRGRHADLAASQRNERRLAFKAIEHPAPAADRPRLREDLTLEVSERGHYRLIRTLTPIGDAQTRLSATVSAAGADLEALLDQVERFPHARQLRRFEGGALQRSYRLEPHPAGEGGNGADWRARLTEAAADLSGVRLELDAEVKAMPAKLRLSGPPGQRLHIPRDLLAVLGRHWRSLDDYASHWRGTLRVARREPRRTRDIENRLERTLAHLAETLARPPADYHRRLGRQRWLVTLRHGIPYLVVLLVIAATPLLGRLPLAEDNLIWVLLFHAPPLMLFLFFFGFDELPSFELPRVPRPLKQSVWLADER
jgi:hypothetical protein